MPSKNFPDHELLSPENLRPYLKTKTIGQEIFYHHELSSTNTEAKRLAVDLAPDGTIVIAEAQNGGQGRLGRGWYSPFGKGIWVTVIIRPVFKIEEAAKCTLLAAVAVCLAIRETAQIFCGIKWPNDILYNGKKLVGILSEMGQDKNAQPYIVVGVGINVNLAAHEFTPDIAERATSLFVAAGQKIDRAKLLANFLHHFETFYHTVNKDGFQPVLDKWRSLSVTLGQEVSVKGDGQDFTAFAADIDSDGALLLHTPSGTRRVVAGDVSIR